MLRRTRACGSVTDVDTFVISHKSYVCREGFGRLALLLTNSRRRYNGRLMFFVACMWRVAGDWEIACE